MIHLTTIWPDAAPETLIPVEEEPTILEQLWREIEEEMARSESPAPQPRPATPPARVRYAYD